MRQVATFLFCVVIASANGQALYIPAVAAGMGNNYFIAGTGDGGTLSTYNSFLRLHYGLAIGSPYVSNGSGGYVEKATISFDGRSGNISTIGNIGIGTNQPISKFHINTDNWAASLLTFSDTHYTPTMLYHFQLESDGLKIRHDNTIDYLFKAGGDFIVNNGAVHAKEVKVSLTPGTGPDYVFEETYNLRSLTDTENYIKRNKHLPEVPSACEMEENGINLSEMNMILLKKVEELTLYQIQSIKRIQVLEEELSKLKNKVNEE